MSRQKIKIAALLLLAFASVGLGVSVILSYVRATKDAANLAEPMSSSATTKASPSPEMILKKKLQQRIDIPAFDGPTPMKEVLKFIADKCSVRLAVNQNHFRMIGLDKPEETPVSLPAMDRVTVQRVLELVLAQIQGEEFHADFVLRGDFVEITTSYHTTAEALGRDPTALPVASGPIVYLDFQDCPLRDALNELAADSGANVLLDARQASKAEVRVTARLNRVKLETALRLLANMADLDVIVVDSVFYVTSKKNADTLAGDMESRRQAERKRLQHDMNDALLEYKSSPFPTIRGARARSQDEKIEASIVDNFIEISVQGTRKGRRILPENADRETKLAFSPSGKILASAGKDGILCIWEVATGQQLRKLPGNGDPISLTFSKDGKAVTVTGIDRGQRTYDLVTGKELDDSK